MVANLTEKKAEDKFHITLVSNYTEIFTTAHHLNPTA